MGRNKKPQVRRLNGWGKAPPGDPVWENDTPQRDAEGDVDTSLSSSWDTPSRPERPRASGVGFKKGKGGAQTGCREACAAYCTLCCSVPAGFEKEGVAELREVFDRRAAFDRQTQLVTVPVPRAEEVHKVLALRSADRTCVLAGTVKGVLARGDRDAAYCLERVQEAAAWVDWGTALGVWAKFSGKYGGSPFEFAEEYEARPPTFRVECCISPESSGHSFGRIDAEEYFAVGVGVHLGWRANNTSSSDVVVGLTVCDRDVTVVVQLKGPVALPAPPRELRLPPTLAHVLLRLARIRPGEIVVDPLCGGGSIGVEGAFAWPNAWHVCGDANVRPIWETQKEAEGFGGGLRLDSAAWNATRLPLRDGTVDAIVTDMHLPTDQQRLGGGATRARHAFGVHRTALKEFARVIRPKVGRAVLVTQNVRPMQEALVACKMWVERKSWPVECRGARARVYVLDIDANWKYERPQPAAAPPTRACRSDVNVWGQPARSGRSLGIERIAVDGSGNTRDRETLRAAEAIGKAWHSSRANQGRVNGKAPAAAAPPAAAPPALPAAAAPSARVAAAAAAPAVAQGVSEAEGGTQDGVTADKGDGDHKGWIIAETAVLFEKECKDRAAKSQASMFTASNPAAKKEGREITKKLKLWISQVGGQWQQVRSKTENLTSFLEALPDNKKKFAYSEMARLLVSKCGNATQNLVFPLAEVVMGTIAKNRPLLEILLVKLHEVCVLTIPKVYRGGSDISEMQKQMGYKVTDEGTIQRMETEDEFLDRQKGYVMFYASLMQVDIAAGIHGIDEAWRYLVRLLCSLPPTRTVAFAVDSFLQIAGFKMFTQYQNQFVKVLKFIDDKFLVELAASTEEETKAVYWRLHTYLHREMFKIEPEGKSMPESSKSEVTLA